MDNFIFWWYINDSKKYNASEYYKITPLKGKDTIYWEFEFTNIYLKLLEIDKDLDAANKSKKPVLIIVNTILGKYSEYENTNKIHGKLDEEDLDQIRVKLKGQRPFYIDEDNLFYKKIVVITGALKGKSRKKKKSWRDFFIFVAKLIHSL